MPATSRIVDPNGFMLVKGCPISSYGIFQYSAAQLGLPGDPNRIVNVFRPESAVSDPEALKSFQNTPLIDDHEMLSGFQNDSDASAPEDKGIDGILTSNVYYEAPWMRGDLKVFSRKLQALLSSGKKDLSLGYGCDFQVQPGVWQGEAYEVVQTNLRGNHIALVEEGRVPGAKVLDGLIFDHLSFSTIQPSDKESKMKRSKKVMDNAVAQLKALLPALEQFLNEEAAEPAHQEGATDPAAAAAVDPAAVAADPAAVAAATADPAVAAQTDTDDPAAAIEAPAPTAEAGAANPEAGAATDPNAGGEQVSAATTDLPTLLNEVKAMVAKIEAQIAGTSGNEGGNDDPETQGAAASGEGSAADPATAAAGEDNIDPGTEGLNATVSAGTGEDAAVRRVYADIAAKNRLYDRLSPVVGAFDHATLDAAGVARYGVKKLGLKAAAGTEAIALDAYLGAREKFAKENKAAVASAAAASGSTTRVGDSASNVDEVAAYLKG